ncbi:MAG: RecX family transcriptional regulator [Naasia sp.]|uniref:regulatory protein RecX n=1 Tax=Naasia sp. TaxID=2546198 RepID=UPI002634CB2D|nr:regulatory protein RecX [Naasia sp.]MCU1571280.1 RecX family transcriptional regulator [Naasia sp.]
MTDEWVAPVISLFGSGRGRADGAADSALPSIGGSEHPADEAPPAKEPGPGEKARERAERRARNVSVAALTRRGMSVAEMRDRLADRGIEPDEIEAEVTRLEDGRYLDDAALAESVVRSETERKGRGRSAVAAELRRRRVDAVAIEEALASLDDEGERERAVQVAENRARQLTSYDAETARRRLAGFLQRRGFSGSVLQHAVDTALGSRR